MIRALSNPIFSRKLSSPLSYIIFSILSCLLVFAITLFKFKIGLLAMAGMAGLIAVFICIINIQVGFYIITCIAFMLSWVQRIIVVELPLASVIDVLCYILVFSILLHNAIDRKQQWLEWHAVTYFMLLYTAVFTLEAINPAADSFLGWFYSYRRVLTNVFLFFISLYLFDDIKKIRFFFKFMVGISLFAALYGCYQQWVGFLPFEKRWLFSDPRIARLYYLGGDYRKFSLLSDPAVFGTLMAATAVSTLILAAGPFSYLKKVLLFVAACFMFFAMAYSGTRTAYIMVPAGILLYALMTIYQKRTQILSFCFGIFFLLILFFPYNGSDTINRIRSAFAPKDDPSYMVRESNRALVQPYIYRHPIGGGLNTTGIMGLKYSPSHYLAGFPPDSGYLLTALETGWVGLAILCGLYLVVLFYTAHYFYEVRSPEIKIFYAAAQAVLFTLMIANYAQMAIGQIPHNVFFFPLLALTIKMHKFDPKPLTS